MAYITNCGKASLTTPFLKKDKTQDKNIHQLKLEIHDTYKKDEKITSNFDSTDDSYVINKSFFDKNLSKIHGNLRLLEKNYNEFILHYNKKPVEDISIQKAVKTTKQKLYDKGLFDNFPNVDEVLIDILLVTRRRGDLDEIIVDIQ